MEHFYQDIDGSFTFQNLYSEAVLCAPPDSESIFVEVGCFRGRSTAYLGVEIFNSQKPIQLHVVDLFCGLEDSDQATTNTDLLQEFLTNIIPLQDASILSPASIHVGDSAEQSKNFADGSLNLVFIDANHNHSNVYQDLEAWYPKLRLGGWLCGHDFGHPSFPGVESAVREFCEKHHKAFECLNDQYCFRIRK